MERQFEDRVFRKAGRISPVVLVDGMALGTWDHTRNGGRLKIAVQPFRKLSTTVKKQIEEETDRLARFLDAQATISYQG